MSKALSPVHYRLYWVTWLILLVITVAMIFVGYAAMPKIFIVFFLLLAMLMKVSLIGGYFMHLRFEKPALIVTVAAGILLTGIVLFVLLVPDGQRILQMTNH